ncbi:helix-turn-helix domain-containing protein [Mesorhizobium shangrilense]|uniref:Helix-turn-helix domain-containing protein n=1 Tax=Mesorhizobium shangrilense TaxID=460060 RepID=A0ABV2DSN7_9HYPH
MARRQRVIDEDQKLKLLQRMEAGETVSKLADEVGISRQRLYEWRDQLRLRGSLKSRRRGRPARSTTGVDGAARLQNPVDTPAPQEKALTKARRRIRELEQKVGQQQLDLDFFREALRHFEEDHRRAALLAKRDLQSHRKDDDRPVARRIQHR